MLHISPPTLKTQKYDAASTAGPNAKLILHHRDKCYGVPRALQRNNAWIYTFFIRFDSYLYNPMTLWLHKLTVFALCISIPHRARLSSLENEKTWPANTCMVYHNFCFETFREIALEPLGRAIRAPVWPMQKPRGFALPAAGNAFEFGREKNCGQYMK